MAGQFLSGMAAEEFSILTEYFGEGANFSFNGSFLYINLPLGDSGIMPCFNRKDLFLGGWFLFTVPFPGYLTLCVRQIWKNVFGIIHKETFSRINAEVSAFIREYIRLRRQTSSCCK